MDTCIIAACRCRGFALVSWTAGRNDDSEMAKSQRGQIAQAGQVGQPGRDGHEGDKPGRMELPEPDKNEKKVTEKTISAEKEGYPEKKIDFVEPSKYSKEYKESEEAPTKYFKIDLQGDKMAEFKGGHEAMTAYIVKNIRYPESAVKTKTTGTVYVTFFVEKTGKVSNASIKKGVDPALDAEAKRVVSNMPDWNPAEVNGEKVEQELTIPVAFRL